MYGSTGTSPSLTWRSWWALCSRTRWLGFRRQQVLLSWCVRPRADRPVALGGCVDHQRLDDRDAWGDPGPRALRLPPKPMSPTAETHVTYLNAPVQRDPAREEANQAADNPYDPVWTADSFSDLDHSGTRQRSQAACRLVPAIFATCDHELSWARVRAASPRDSPTRRVSSSRYPKAAGSSLSASKRMLAWARSAKSLGVA